ncbi:phospholipid/glycerol acyltransferase [Acidimicrobium ferrooxidans DSM 10331]|uniref:Phospholipid/glycerol acyltransferase n=1 Tax=Acidimicrobium ferrooxidans (strain DSM 10331 / JCM 15462 / NBRC 103882 / ICP) TaxID=525909 RepID=C7M045_ACIFD|nr:phospholipid/glycerol acyltransferase [Acidimicrobium ferrooxidans DSM 10331]
MKLPASVRFVVRAPSPPGQLPFDRTARTGVEFDTSFARRDSVRVARAVLLDGVVLPGVRAIARPRLIAGEVLDALDEPVVFVANHQSHLDTPVVLSVLPARVRHRTVVGAGADYFFDRPSKAFASALVLGAIPIERQRVSRRSAELAEQLVEEGWNLLLFPEGGRTPDGLPQEPKAGAAQVALRTGRPVVPLFIDGTWEILGKGQRRLRPGSTTIVVGEPLTAREGERPGAFTARIADALALAGREAATDFWEARRTKGTFVPEGRSWIELWQRSAHRHRDERERLWPRNFGSRTVDGDSPEL